MDNIFKPTDAMKHSADMIVNRLRSAAFPITETTWQGGVFVISFDNSFVDIRRAKNMVKSAQWRLRPPIRVELITETKGKDNGYL